MISLRRVLVLLRVLAWTGSARARLSLWWVEQKIALRYDVAEIRVEALAAGALSVLNLRGGLFRWYNEGHPVVDAQGETDDIYPFGPDWEHLVEKRSR
ncbi:MAG: hypothetical protein K9M82_12565 [Deltaproteobacteria bacterium]|nr:hypothetical protein [Deltaproteobacteria bacterium]